MEKFSVNTGDLLSIMEDRLYVASRLNIVQSFGMNGAIILYATPKLAELLEEWYEEAFVSSGMMFLRQEDSSIELSVFDSSHNKISARYTDHGVSRTPATGLVPIRCSIGAETADGARVQDMDLYAPIDKIFV